MSPGCFNNKLFAGERICNIIGVLENNTAIYMPNTRLQKDILRAVSERNGLFLLNILLNHDFSANKNGQLLSFVFRIITDPLWNFFQSS